MKNHLILFAKYPTPGRVKTRLAAQLGEERAAAYYKEMVETVVAAVLPEDDSYALTCYFDPPEQESAFREWLTALHDFHPQCAGELGTRLLTAFRDSCVNGAHKTVIIGSDCVDVTRELIGDAFERLETHDVVVGPAEDGGYYLIGMKTVHPELFNDIEWSTERVLAQTLEKARQAGLEVYLLPILRDIDQL
jgi:rSAM/selenodomain-associated transferase 1